MAKGWNGEETSCIRMMCDAKDPQAQHGRGDDKTEHTQPQWGLLPPTWIISTAFSRSPGQLSAREQIWPLAWSDVEVLGQLPRRIVPFFLTYTIVVSMTGGHVVVSEEPSLGTAASQYSFPMWLLWSRAVNLGQPFESHDVEIAADVSTPETTTTLLPPSLDDLATTDAAVTDDHDFHRQRSHDGFDHEELIQDCDQLHTDHSITANTSDEWDPAAAGDLVHPSSVKGSPSGSEASTDTNVKVKPALVVVPPLDETDDLSWVALGKTKRWQVVWSDDPNACEDCQARERMRLKKEMKSLKKKKKKVKKPIPILRRICISVVDINGRPAQCCNCKHRHCTCSTKARKGGADSGREAYVEETTKDEHVVLVAYFLDLPFTDEERPYPRP
ncbi:hypothetical protein CALCODRAFT_513137 [Calocera cornea HHB12733]|uniref:Uncharacterized protein n=1 Tax=Calocera cornea HHB12733 TaxID=1353952 RepID=A0A165CFL3_9BASI|nr:hypothetical protein CALCODRAFT_513137 [Calocera cornea HHB12733]